MSTSQANQSDRPENATKALGHLLYISDALRPFSRAELHDIRDVSIRNNAKCGITGVLFYSAGHFVQLLEGDMGAIHQMFEKIASDTRHLNVRLLVLRPAATRVFADWSMGLLDMGQHSDAQQRDLDELVKLASDADSTLLGTPVELEILSRFCMLLPAC